METSGHPVERELVLIGGGHSHVAVLKKFAMRPEPGLRLTVLAKDLQAPYSGMLPGYIAGQYQHHEAHIDLRPLAQLANARLFHTEVTGINLAQQRVICLNRPPVHFDQLAINIGSTPDLNDATGAHQFTTPVKPVKEFLQRWQQWLQQAEQSDNPVRLAIVGTGASGIELALSCQQALRRAHPLGQNAEIHLIGRHYEILPSHNHQVRLQILQKLRKHNIQWHLGSPVMRVEKHHLMLQNGLQIDFDHAIWAAQAAAPSWLQRTGLALDEQGFIQVNEQLQSVSHGNIFAAGDIAQVGRHHLAKSGVYAVRQGPVLADNLRRQHLGKPLRRYRPQKHFLSLLGMADGSAIASRGNLAAAGHWVWRWKDHIDRRFMQRFQVQPPTLSQRDEHMRCGGCAAKVAPDSLLSSRQQWQPYAQEDIVAGLTAADDASVIQPPAGKQLVQTVDYFRAFIDDPYLVGKIAANHCLGDLYAMAAKPHSALAIATLPYAANSVVADTLGQLMMGVNEVLREQQISLIGGHSSEGAELAIGLSLNGWVDADHWLSKTNLRPGQQLILTKPLGTGTLFAANQNHAAEGQWIEQALHIMQQSQAVASHIFVQHGVSACTDVTGFGLAGHLLEMARGQPISIELQESSLPWLNGARQTMQLGFLSSLSPANREHACRIHSHADIDPLTLELLYDPQTAGGLVAAIDESRVDDCLQALHANGYAQARVIGNICDAQDSGNMIEILP